MRSQRSLIVPSKPFDFSSLLFSGGSIDQRIVEWYLGRAGVLINGRRQGDIRIHDPVVYRRLLWEQSIGLGESYMDGHWDCDRLDLLFERVFAAGLSAEGHRPLRFLKLLQNAIVNLQSMARATEVCEKHYDLGNDLYQKMLDPQMVYTCGYWKKAETLEQAQFDKMDMICKKLNLKPGQTLLDIGCGFGSFLKHAATHYGVRGVGITLSRQQYDYAISNCVGLPIEIRFQDYRNLPLGEKYDRIASVGMFEAVGYKNFRNYMEIARRSLKDDGAFLLHTIGTGWTRYPVGHWVDKYIFPNGYSPSMSQISKSVEKLFMIQDVQDFGPDYSKTLMAWHSNFEAHWPELQPQYGDRFKRMWDFYLLSFAGGFRARHWQLFQVLLTTPQTRLSAIDEARLPDAG